MGLNTRPTAWQFVSLTTEISLLLNSYIAYEHVEISMKLKNLISYDSKFVADYIIIDKQLTLIQLKLFVE